MPSLDQIILLLTQYGYFILFPIAVVEGPIIAIIGGFLDSGGIFNPYILYGVLVAADLVGDSVLYAVGRWGKGLIVGRFGLTREHLATLAVHYKEKGGWTIIVGKITHSAGFAVLISAGSAEMPFFPFLFYNLLGTLPKSLVLLGIGYFFGSAYNQINDYILRISIILFVLIVAAVGYYFFAHRKKA